MLKFLHCADIHLDMPFTSLGTETDRSSIRRQDLKDVFDSIINLAREEKVNLLLISGDLYEHNYVRKSTINYINERFNSIPDIHVIIVPGNHDPYIVNSYYRNHAWSKNVNILRGDRPFIKLDSLDTCIYGFGFESFYEDRVKLDKVKLIDSSLVNIMLIHGTIDMEISGCNGNTKPYNNITSDELSNFDVDYIALGHFHNRLEKIGKTQNIYNPGSPEPLGFDEEGDHGVFLGTIDKCRTNESQLDVQFVKLNKRYYESLDIDVGGCLTNEQIIYRINARLEGKDTSKGLFNIRLKGYCEKGFSIDLRQIQNYYTDRLFFLKLVNETAEGYNLEELACEPGLRGLFSKRMLQKIEDAQDPHERVLLMKALFYGLQALEEGKVDIFNY